MKRAFDKFCALFAAPESIFSDNGPEINLIDIPRNTTPSNFPQPNWKDYIKNRKLCRIHSVSPNEAISILQTTLKKALFFDGLSFAPV